ncbi:hypothetical protein Lser_V15G16106 [Lactuca serriola]
MEKSCIFALISFRLLNTKAKVEELRMKLSALEAKTHSVDIERVKLRKRLNVAQKRLDGMRMRGVKKKWRRKNSGIKSLKRLLQN